MGHADLTTTLIYPRVVRSVQGVMHGAGPHAVNWRPWSCARCVAASWTGREPSYGDLRTSPERLYHPECYAERFGLRAVLELVAEHDQKERRGFWKMWDEIESLKKRLAAREGE